MSIKKILKSVFSSQSAVFRRFAEHYDMVYFGKLHLDDEEHRIVRGITVSTQHVDEQYCVGTVNNFDIILLKRTDTIVQPNSTRSEKYSWILMQLDLHSKYDHPHVFVDGGHHDELFYNALFVKFARLMKVDKALFGENRAFTERFTAYTPPDSLDDLPLIVGGDIGKTMAQHFAHLDFEWFQDRLIVYSTGRMPTKHLLEHMLRAGLWLAEVLDHHGDKKIAAHGGADIHHVEQTG
ncbi:TPA: hypothetical protein DCF80_01700 [Candidatus Saccharibacteria bacterium]|nr:hypothetical protein [Candidatus Saccharibacteria bacterium]HRK40875.1 hypothetical protein [Candidatus Saccharibacteria bacterium]